jgi:excisionase family DNA binding protein
MNNKYSEAANSNSVEYDQIESSNGSKLFFDNLIWGIDEVCTFTGYAKGTVYNLVSKGEIPYRSRGRKRKLVFVPSEVIAWFKGELK